MNRSAKIVVALIVGAVVGFFIYSKLASWHKEEVETAVGQEQQAWQEKADRLEQKVAGLQDELAAVKGRNIPEQKLAAVFSGRQKQPEVQDAAENLAEVEKEVKKLGRVVKDEKVLAAMLGDAKQLTQALGDDTKLLAVIRKEDKLARILRDEKKLAAILHDEKKLAQLWAEENASDVRMAGVVRKKISDFKVPPDLADIEHRIRTFFSYLDRQPYVQAYGLDGGTYLQYQVAISKLSSNSPAIVDEMQSLYSMVRNVAHLYRVMGKKPLHLTREILQNESEVIEPVMATFYRWYIANGGGRSDLGGCPSPTIMYDYAGFLLNTLGGRSYLLRRAPKIRALITYYCVLVLDRANDEGLNENGIDIRPYIKTSLMEVENQIGLLYQKEYLAKLDALSLKYLS